MSFTQEQAAEAAAYIQGIKTAHEEADQAKAAEALKNLKTLLLSVGKVAGSESKKRLAQVQTDFKVLIRSLSAECQKEFLVIQLIIEIHDYGDILNENLIEKAALWGDIGCFRLLTETYGVNVNLVTALGQGSTALHIAAINGHVDLVEYLLTLPKANIDVRNLCEETPLFCAVGHGAIEMVKCLLDHKAQVNAKSNMHRTPLMEAAAYDNFRVNINILRVLIAYGADVNAVGKSLHETALNYAIQAGVIEKVRLLLENGACISEESYQSIRVDYNDTEIRALLDDHAPASHAEIDNILDNLRRPSILRAALLDTNLVIPAIVNTVIVPYAHQLEEDGVPDDKAKQQGQAISRIARVRQALQEDLPALFAAGIISAEKQVAAESEIIRKLKNEDLQAECRAYCDQRRQAQKAGQDPVIIVPPWAHYKVEMLTTASPSESKEMKATSTTTTSGQSSPDHLEISEAKEVTMEAKGMPGNSVLSNQARRDGEVSSSTAALHTPGVGFHSSTVMKAEGKPKVADADSSNNKKLTGGK
jgi:ankyrin repeat protein